MDRVFYRPLIVATGFLVMVGGSAAAEDDPIREKALGLNRVSGTKVMAARLIELVKDEAGTKKLLPVAVKMVKDEKPRPLNFNACFILAKAAQFLKDVDSSLVFYRSCAEEAAKLASASKITYRGNGNVTTCVP